MLQTGVNTLLKWHHALCKNCSVFVSQVCLLSFVFVITSSRPLFHFTLSGISQGNVCGCTVSAAVGVRLPYLPLAVRECCSLKAVWLSETQAQSLPVSQTDVDETSGDNVLTCFLLPQQRCLADQQGN